MSTLNYGQWLVTLDQLCENVVGISIYDLTDQNFMDMYDDEYSPLEALREIMENEGLAVDV